MREMSPAGRNGLPGLLGCVGCLALACSPRPVSSAPQPQTSPAPSSPADEAPDVKHQGPASNYQVVDLMPEWWSYWEAAQSEPPARRVELFLEGMPKQHPAVFSANVLSKDPSVPFDLNARVSEFLEGAEPLVPSMRAISRNIRRDLPDHQASFQRAFPDFAWDGTVYFTVSLDAFDGAVREVDGKPVLLFGVDKIARLYGADVDLAPLFHHELFHVYHLVTRTPFDPAHPDRMYQALWGEGLAVYVAKRLNPAATNRQLVLTDEMVEQGEAKLPKLAAEMLANLDSGDEAFYTDWFRGAGKRTDMPVRMGYFLGYKVAEVLGRSRSLKDLAAMKDPELRTQIGHALETLASP
ncbi:MAG: hypothetical protein AB7S68_40325 [Polyangiaceae bacterium]